MELSLRTAGAPRATAVSLPEVLRELGPRFAERAPHYDASETFVAENFAELKARGVLRAGVPVALGGGGASLPEIADFLRGLAACCASTALALSMHSHQVAVNAWRWQHEKAPVEPLLRRVAAENLVLVSSGGADWLQGSGAAEPVPGGGVRITARKSFASGVPAGDLLMTSAVLQDPEAGPTVLHFAVPLKSEAVKLHDTWHVLGMRGSGSQDVSIEGFFVAEGAIGLRRPQGKWHPLFHLISMVAFPLIFAVYLGIAEAARDRALLLARRRRDSAALPALVGEMENELALARLAHRAMVETAAGAVPGPETTKSVMTGRTLVGQAALRTVERALEVAGGLGFFRDSGLERHFRDVQAARFHPLQREAQIRYSGRLALGMEIDG